MTALASGGRASRLLRTAIALSGVATLGCAIALASVSSAGAATPRCQTGGLVVWIDTQGNGTAGTIFYTLQFTNLSGHACTLRGYPRVSAVNLAGRQVGSEATRLSGTPVRTLTVGKGGTVKANLGIVDVGNFPRAVCRPTTAAGLRVLPPNGLRSKVIPFPFAACSRTGTPFLRVDPVVR